MARTPRTILDGLTKTLRDNIALRAAHPIGGKPKPGPIAFGGGPKIELKPAKPKDPAASGRDGANANGTPRRPSENDS